MIYQSRATVDPVSGYSAIAYPVDMESRHKFQSVAKNYNQTQDNQSQYLKFQSVAKQLTNCYEESPKLDVVSRCLTQLQVFCSGGTVDAQLREPSCVGKYQSQGEPGSGLLSVTSTEYVASGHTQMLHIHSRYLFRSLFIFSLTLKISLSHVLVFLVFSLQLFHSSHHIDFDSVFGIDDTGLVQMFETLIATGLKEFLGCPAVFYEAALAEFFENSSVRDGVVVNTIRGTMIEISENNFATTFGLPVDGLTDLSEEMKIQYRLLSDILAKTLYVKAGSFDAVTHDRFMLMTAITFDVKVNWSSLLFGVLQDMVTPGSRQAKGLEIQICVILKNVPGLVLGESRSFPASRVLSEKTVHRKRYILLKYREMLLRKFLESRRINFAPGVGSSAVDLKILHQLSDILSVALTTLKEQAIAHGLTWKSMCCSKVFEGHTRDRGAVIARTNTKTPSTCWIRTMLFVDGFWAVEPCADYWVKIPRPVVHNEVPRQLSYVDTLPAISLSARLDESKSDIISKIHTIEKGLRDSLKQQEEAFRNLIQGERQESALRFNEFRKGVLANSASVTADIMDIKKAVRELNAKVDAVSTRLDDVKKDVEATKEAISHQLLDFQAQAQDNYNILTGQLRELVNYINRGGNDKNGEGSSRGLQPQPYNQNRESGDAGGDTARSIVERLISADRERERSRGNKIGSYKRRRY
ncbi:hypothetical protein F511_41804 [Dorcoceras hygrometricum]|uniref:Uncharacterized protein n=1 Tax=Dorcoceras hygrometricum TaxID=472368 RepID=A0A2Z7B5L4_9LAMI|nr:hypothetical protein F511_41804 [Dorcoceras hygrometricum]